MRQKVIPVFVALLLGGSAAASETCSLAADRIAERQGLLETLAQSPNARDGRAAADAIWRYWTTAPDDRAQKMLDEGMQSIRYGEPLAAEVILADLIAYCPGYPEAWNQRAFARYLAGDLDGSLEDIATTLDLEPAHFGALAGKIMILVRQDKRGLARLTLIEALKVHPWLREGGLLGVEGQEL